MIGRINGIILEKQPPVLLIDVNGVGYEIEASMNTFYRLPDLGQKVVLHTHFVVREDAQLLFGFFDQAERSLFRTLIKVSGVGPKLALAILSSVTPNEFSKFVLDGDTNALVRLPGIGKKTAERLIIEMRDRLKHLSFNQGSHEVTQIHFSHAQSPEQEAVSALVALGYKPQEASRAIAKIDVGNLSSEDIIRQALQGMVSTK